MQTHDIRKRFLDHFIRAGHTEVPSASLILDDPNLMFVNAGMVPFKPYFLGQQTPPFSRATSVQKCVRTLDIDEVGITTRHNTFFQMAGNFSFGDYFKREAITFAWTLLTNSVTDGGYGIDPQKLWPTVYLDDDEAEAIWRDEIGVPAHAPPRTTCGEVASPSHDGSAARAPRSRPGRVVPMTVAGPCPRPHERPCPRPCPRLRPPPAAVTRCRPGSSRSAAMAGCRAKLARTRSTK